MSKKAALNLPQVDFSVAIIALVLMAIGSVMIISSSLPYAETQNYSTSFYFAYRHFIYLGLGLMAAIVCMSIPVSFWQKYGPSLLVLSIFLLIAVLIFGRTVNGSRRWIVLGPITVQVSELVKLFVIAYIAGYLVRRSDEIQTQIKGFVKPLLVLGVITVLLVLEPDFGAAAVITVTTLGMMFLAGAKLWQFIALSLTVTGALSLVAISQPYRLERLTVFLDPWKDPFGAGYQLTQSLIAYGRGGWFGEGLGNSIQKLSYLPEAHTDFVFAVYAEEFGFVGVSVVLALFFLLFYKSMQIARRALEDENTYGAFLAFGISIWIVLQAIVNIGVTNGALPTKGLTLPFISYGGSSLIVCCAAIAILMRIDFETEKQNLSAKNSAKKEVLA